MRNGQLYQRPTLERPIAESDFSSLPTPHAGLGERGRDGVILNPKGQQDLQHAIAHLLPTPVADHSRGLPQKGTDLQSLPNVAISLLPTPRAQTGEQRNMNNYASPLDQPQNLENALALIGDSTNQPSNDGNTSSDDQHQTPQLWEQQADLG
jgi:hypothetical protein